ncbi:DNA mismatch repair protein [Podosphaera aphanis]|nr:DNA mismatch repair protein [Podosphaera aphanis]
MSKVPISSQAQIQPTISQFFIKKQSNKASKPVELQSSSRLAGEAEHARITDVAEVQEEQPPVPLGRKRKAEEHESSDEHNGTLGVDLDSTKRSTKRLKNDKSNENADDSISITGEVSSEIALAKPKSLPEKNKYFYSQSTQLTDFRGENNVTPRSAEKEYLHEQWVKKMSNVKIGRCFHKNENKTIPNDEDDVEDDDETAPKARKKGAKTGKLTPLELQVLEVKKNHMDTILIVEVGYKFKFFGDDARVAAKELGLVCIPGKYRYDEDPSEAHLDRFASASIPVHRLPVHAKRLVQAGHKIGIVRQAETAALKKAGDNRRTPFTRKLTEIYTKGTYIGDQDTAGSDAPAAGYLFCLTESKSKGGSGDEKVKIGILAVQPATGDIIYDTVEDGMLRTEIETRLLHLHPCELLVVGELTQATEKLVQHLTGTANNVSSERIRVERVEKRDDIAAGARSHVSQFYGNRRKGLGSDSIELDKNLVDQIQTLPENVLVCLSAMITHLTEYGMESIFDLTKYFESFTMRSHMLLNCNALTSLEIYQNQTDFSEKGSLFWCLNKTKTRFGRRLLRKWVGRPLLDRAQLEDRINAIVELKDGHQTAKIDKLHSLLRNIKTDLERSLLRIYYGKCSRPELLTALQTLQNLSNEYAHVKTPSDAGFESSMLKTAIARLPSINVIVNGFLSKINTKAGQKDDKYAFFHPDHESDLITNHKMGIAVVEQELDAHRTYASSIVKKSRPLTYITVSGVEYLFELPNTDLKHVPASWIKVSGTRKVSRFHTPEVVRMLRERDQHKESLSAACDAAYIDFLHEISLQYALLRDTISALATLDCLVSLSLVAQRPGYSKPCISETTCINIVQGRHPMVELLLPSAYISNTTTLSTAPGQTRALCITGPNMGGKSSYVRHVALLVLMAQIGSYLPCESAVIGLIDGIYTRIGAYDSIFTRQSTFQVELSETASILKNATSRSLVIIDELGRGTSTHDGVAIAESTLEWIVQEIKSLCLFITHYQSLAAVAKIFKTDGALKNVHMKFQTDKTPATKKSAILPQQGCDEEITFLYEVEEGVAHRSYGLNVAKLAHVPRVVLDTAAKKSHEMEIDVKMRKLSNLSRMMNELLIGEANANLEQLVVGIEGL